MKPRFELLEGTFTFLYVIELIWKLCEKRLDFFTGGDVMWNLFDAVITITGAVDAIIQVVSTVKALFSGGGNQMQAAAREGHSSGASVARLFRVMRILRIFRALRFLSDVEHVIYTAGKATLKLVFLVFLVVFVAPVVATHILYNAKNQEIRHMF